MGTSVVSSGIDKSIKIWELVGRDAGPAYGHTAGLLAVAVSPNGKFLATGAQDGLVILWDPATGKKLTGITAHAGRVTALVFTGDSKYLASAGEDRTLKLWDTATFKGRAVDPPPSDQVPVLTSADGGKQIISWSSGSLLEAYDVATGKQVPPPQTAHTNPTSALVFSADGSIAALGGKDGSIRLWDTTKKAAVAGSDFPAHQEKIIDLLLTADKKTLITTDAKGNVSVWDLGTLIPVKAGVQPKPVKTWQAHQESIVAFAVSPDGKFIATAGQDNVVKVWETQTGKDVRQWDFHLAKVATHNFIRNLAFTPDSKQLATANADTTAYVLQLP